MSTWAALILAALKAVAALLGAATDRQLLSAGQAQEAAQTMEACLERIDRARGAARAADADSEWARRLRARFERRN